MEQREALQHTNKQKRKEATHAAVVRRNPAQSPERFACIEWVRRRRPQRVAINASAQVVPGTPSRPGGSRTALEYERQRVTNGSVWPIARRVVATATL